jgi:FkbM family methyltransferase
MIAVQVGSNRGYDDFTNLIQQKKLEKLILVEPFIEHNDSLNNCYSYIDNLTIENVIITDDDSTDESTIFFHKEDTNHINKFELASLNKFHSLKIRNHYNELGICERKIKSLTINKLFLKHNLKEIDILFIDTEGFDDKIIENINFDEYFINEIYYENLHIDSSKLKIFLENKGYIVTQAIGYGGWTDFAKLKE